MATRNWLQVDEDGYEQQLARLPKYTILYELIQNALDQDGQEVRVTIEPVPNRPLCRVIVEDEDPEGFQDLALAYTLFASTEKRRDPEKRGRFTIGEKQVIVRCEEASIVTTKGSVVFDKSGRRTTREKREVGSVFKGLVRMTRAECEEAVQHARRIIPPHNKNVTVNGVDLVGRPLMESFPATLPTEFADESGNMKRTARKTLVSIHSLEDSEAPYLYEMGIPVVELMGGEPFHIDISQRVLLNSDRDGVTPAYLRDLRTTVLNHMHRFIKDQDEAAKAWVRDAAADPAVEKEALATVVKARFGDKVVSHDPSQPEPSKLATHMGYTVVPGGALSKGEWENIKREGLILPAPKVTPTEPEKTADATLVTDESAGMIGMRRFVEALGRILLGKGVEARFVRSPGATVLATYGNSTVTFNVSRLRKDWFDTGVSEEQLDLVLHELGHELCGDHLSKRYNDALTGLGAKLAFYIADHPSFLRDHSW